MVGIRLRVRARRPERTSKRWRRIALRTAAAVGLLLLGAFVLFDRAVLQHFEARTTSLPSRVYAAPFTVARGSRIEVGAMLEQLRRLGYREVRRAPERPGDFLRQGNDWEIFLNSAVTPAGKREAFPVALDVRWGRLRRITDSTRAVSLDAFSLEPEPLFTFYAELMEERRWTALEEIPEELRQAVLAVEDRRFFDHHGVDAIGIARAAGVNFRAGEVLQGGSTITQQLVKNLLGPGPRTLGRKLREAVAALALELHRDKDAILEAYFNEVYLGQLGPVAISGVGDASRYFFGAHVRDLDLPRAAMLAGMIRNPGRFNPRRDPEAAQDRRDLVLRMMHERGLIDDTRLQSALAAPLGIVRASSTSQRLPWVEDYLAGSIAALAPEAVPSRAGYSVFTTFDPAIQRAAEEALEAGLARLERRLGRREGEPLEGAVVVLRPADGALLALVGGRDYSRSQYNRAVQAHRPPGSTFKPFVYLAGLERALREEDFELTAATVLEDEPLQLRAGGRLWTPENYDRHHRGPITVREALEQSVNVPTVRAALEIGLPAIAEIARRCGVDSTLEAVPALALGVEEVTPLELARAYAVLANGGSRVEPHGLETVLDREGLAYVARTEPPQPVIDPTSAYIVTDLLKGVVARGTGHAAGEAGFAGRAAGKTGTSDGLRDAWFVGYTPDLLALVWVGYDDNRPIGLAGAGAALPIWVELATRVGAQEADEFPQPGGVVVVPIDPATGMLATRRCPEERDEVFALGTEPQELCTVHGSWRLRDLWW